MCAIHHDIFNDSHILLDNIPDTIEVCIILLIILVTTQYVYEYIYLE